MPTVAEHRFVRHGRVLVIVRVVAVRLDDHLEGVAVVHRRVDFFAVAAEVVIDAAAAEHRAAGAVVDRHLGRHDADAGRPLDEDRIGREQRVVFDDDRLELVEERFALLQPAAAAGRPWRRRRVR